MSQISIIIPVYNSEKYIARCIDSIISQINLPSIELIIVDDGSTDNTPLVLQKYARNYSFIKIVTQKNQKQSAARNNGLSIAKGKYILFIDSDDYLDEKMISTMYSAIEKEETDLCVCGIKKIFKNRNEIETKCCFANSKDPIADYLIKQREIDVGLWNKLFRRSIIEENGLIFENGNFFEDTLFVFKYLCNVSHGISTIEQPLYRLVKREESTTTSFSPEIEGYSRTLISTISAYLLEKNLPGYNKYLTFFETRCLVHIIHHHIKFNDRNKNEKIREFLSRIEYKCIFILPLKYKLAVLLLKANPMVYAKIYSRRI